MVSQSSVVLALAICAFAAAADVRQCPGQSIAGLAEDVKLTSCNKFPCKLRKGTTQNITINFTVEKETPDVTNRVSAEVFGVPLPFVGVDGNSICDKVFKESGEAASCPLQAGVKYTYKDSFTVHTFYPSISNLKVHWELLDKKQIVSCFEVPAKIL